jgi:hypothetical protein
MHPYVMQEIARQQHLTDIEGNQPP